MPTQKVQAADEKASAPEILENLVRLAERAGASDIHLQMRGKSAEVGFRLDGIITPGCELTADVAERVFGRIKFLARLKTYQESLPQDGRISHDELKCKNDIRVATYPTVTGEKIVLRLFNSTSVKKLEEIEFPENARSELESFLRQTSGLLLLTGPAGSGKTTTIYACLRISPNSADVTSSPLKTRSSRLFPARCRRRSTKPSASILHAPRDIAAARPAGFNHRRDSRRSHRATRRPRRTDRASRDFHIARRFVQRRF
jgi:hypothetical protein